MNRKSNRDFSRKPRKLDTKGNSTTCVYYLGRGGEVVGRTTTFATPEMRKRKDAIQRELNGQRPIS